MKRSESISISLGGEDNDMSDIISDEIDRNNKELEDISKSLSPRYITDTIVLSDKQLKLAKVLYKLAIWEAPLSRVYFDYIHKSYDTLDNITIGRFSTMIKRLRKIQPISLSDGMELIMSFDWQQLRPSISTWRKTYNPKNKITKVCELSKYELDAIYGTHKILSVDIPILVKENYEYGRQKSKLFENDTMYYIKFYDVCMIDYDNISLEDVISRLEPYKDIMLFEIMKTFKGYHVYIISELIDFKYSFELLIQMGSDFMYAVFTRTSGYKIRLNHKLGRDEQFVEEFVCRYGNAHPNKTCEKYLKLKNFYINKQKENREDLLNN
jgi:hypothetical protein